MWKIIYFFSYFTLLSLGFYLFLIKKKKKLKFKQNIKKYYVFKYWKGVIWKKLT
ncbi:hypothetical protein GIG_02186 [Mycoplasmopsis anatis 1340]|uniref:Uncharacterized protein n=1 Tax=Mycoplasmopsis anatis 1340 TaxID=1034808 RepID=F9QDD0_9BACT|nr:hypothetical protein GIG_02186 [Mycoplasmopsis anatis 1340]